MKANIIKSLKNNAEVIEIEAGKTAYQTFEGVNFDNAVLIINGKVTNPDYIINEGDVVTLRLVPADLTETPWWVATFIIPFGFLIQPAELAYKAKKEAEEAERELEKIKKLTNQPDIDNSPFLRGATNSIATGKSQPYFCGRNFLTPYLFSKPYYRITGTDGVTQDVFNILEGGFKDIVLEKLGIGDTVIKEFNETAPQSGVYNISSGIFANGQVEIRQDGEPFQTLTQLNNKVNSNVINKEIVKAYKVQQGDGEYLVLSLDPSAMDVDLCINFPYGLYQYNEDNDRVETSVTITAQYSLDGGSTWTTYKTQTYTKNTIKALRYVLSHSFTYENYQTLAQNGQSSITIRVLTSAGDDQKKRDDCYVYYYQSKIFDPLKSSSPAGVLDDSGAAGLVPCLNVENRERGYSCVIGLRLRATTNNEQKLSQINIIACSTARTWNSEEGAWSETKTATRNPAAIALEVLTSDIHPASRYDDTEIDLDAFGAFYEYCENNDLYYDNLVTQNQRKDAILQQIADVCGIAFYKDIYGRRSVAIDQVQENSIAVYNPQNIIKITNKKSFARRVDALRIKYIDSVNDTYKENSYTVTRLENGQPVTIDENSIIKEVNAIGITRQSQVVKYARRLMAIDELRPITTTIQIGAEGVYYTPYAKISIQDPSLNSNAIDGVVKSVVQQNGLLTKIVLEAPVTFDPNKNYGVIVNITTANGAVPIALHVTGTGTTDTLLVDDTYTTTNPQPAHGNVISFGELDDEDEFSKITHEFVITRIARTEGGFNLDLQEYNEAIYEPGAIPAYKPLVNNTPVPSEEEIPLDAVTREELEERIDHVNGDVVQAAVDTIQNGYRFTNVYRVRPVESSLEEIIAKIDDEARNRSASISISEEEILLQVEDVERALIGMISVQAGAVTALVAGGGAEGQMSLTINLPILINSTLRAELIAASSEAKVNAVYGIIENSTNYGIKGNATKAAVKALWDDAVAAGLLASQIELQADQIYLNGEVIINEDDKLKASLIDVENLLAQNITLKQQGYIKSNNYAEDGNGTPTAGFMLDEANNVIKSYNMLANGGTYKNITAEELRVKNGLRLATMVGGDQLSGLVNTLFAAISNYPKHPNGENTYTAAGYAEDNEATISFSFTAVSYELVWSGNTINGVILRGSGLYSDTSITLGLIKYLQIMPSGTSYVAIINGVMKPLPVATHSVLYI